MKVKVKERGVTVPKRMLHRAQEVSIREEGRRILVGPLSETEPEEMDPTQEFGREPVRCSASNAAEDHGHYLHGK